VVVSTGIVLQKLPCGTYGRIAPRSGLAVKHGLDTLAGVVDPDYRGEIKVVLINTDMRVPFVIKPGYRIAQLILEKYEVADVVEVTEVTVDTDRGETGFGSTGVAFKVTGV
jgi:dUTP pyrophosphatase